MCAIRCNVDILIPSFNGRKLLGSVLTHLPDIIGSEHRITVVDDASTDDSVDFVSSKYPEVQLITRKINGGFAAAVNEGIRATQGEYILLLNSDVELTAEILDNIIPVFSDPNVFAVSPKITIPQRGGIDEGCKTGFWHHGMFYADQRQGVTSQTPILYATGCAAVYRRSMLEALGGFDEAYSPFYWEDADLGYRAWKRGWKTIYQPESVAIHQHSSTISTLDRRFTDKIKSRNALLFIWRNIEDRDILAVHQKWLPLVIAKKAMQRDMSFVAGYKEARKMCIEALAARDNDSQQRTMTDREIFEICEIAC
ncbi:MAG: glycosyltransferase family 2 protein [Armatimonadota bacterium]|nr:glycosyltransferase family 2 protein [bacterium]